jgi:hypothetical protein
MDAPDVKDLIIDPQTGRWIRVGSIAYNRLLEQGILNGDEKRFSQQEKRMRSEDRSKNRNVEVEQRPENRRGNRVAMRSPQETPRYYLVLRGNREYVGIFFSTRRALVPRLEQRGIGPDEPIDVIDVEQDAERFV